MSETRPAMGSDQTDYVMVPREPTEEMLRAGLVGVEEPAAPLVGMRRLSNAYRAMLSAALPSAPRSDEGAVAYRIDLGHGFNYYDAAPGKYEKLQAQGRPIQPLYAAPPSPPPSVEVGEMGERLKASAERHRMYAVGTYGPRVDIFLEKAAQDDNDASLLIALDAERRRMREALEERFEQYRNARDALYQFKYPPDPKLLREIANEIDCGNDCAHGYTEWDSNAHVCSRSERKEGCAGEKASCLRQFADAIGIRSAAVDQTGGVTSPDYVMVPKQELGSIIYDIENGFTETAMKQLEKLLSAAPPSPRSEMREALEAARQFIVNGVELGYIHIPKNDPAEHTLGKINAALKES